MFPGNIPLVHFEKICFAPTLCEPRSVHSARPKGPLSRPVTVPGCAAAMASATSCCDRPLLHRRHSSPMTQPSERRRRVGKVGAWHSGPPRRLMSLAQHPGYRGRWLCRRLARWLLPDRPQPSCSVLRGSASSLRLLMCRRRLFRAYCVVPRGSLSLGDKGDNGRHQTKLPDWWDSGLCWSARWRGPPLGSPTTDLVAAGAHYCGHVCGFVPRLCRV